MEKIVIEAALWPGMVLFMTGLVLAGILANFTQLGSPTKRVPHFEGERDDLAAIVFPE